MAGIQLSGLASGFDWKSVVDQLMSLNRIPQDKLRTDKANNIEKLSSFTSLRTTVTSLQTAVKALSADALFGQRSVSLADPDSTWHASAGSQSATGEYTFNVTALATKSERAGEAGRATSLSATDDVSGLIVADLRLSMAVSEGIFTVNGAQIEVGATDTLEMVFDKISDATTAAGSPVTASYNASTDRVSLAGTGAITLGSGVDTSNFLYALKLYNRTPSTNTLSSAADLGAIEFREAVADAGLAASITGVDGSGNGSFKINGTTIDYNLNTDSLQTIISRVNDSAAGATLAYDSANDRFLLTNDNTGDLGLTVSEAGGGLLAALGLASDNTVTRGSNAVFSVNGGGAIVSASNKFDSSLHGMGGLTVTADSTGSQVVTVKADTEALEEGVRGFIDKFNGVQKFIDEQTKITVGSDGKVIAAQFANNRELTEMARSLRGIVFDQVSGLSGAFTRLESMGIDFNGTSSQLSVRDEVKFTDALTNNQGAVAAMFTTPTAGITGRLNEYLERLTLNAGTIDTQENTLETQNSGLDKQIADLDRRLVSERSRLEAGFIRMEQAQSLINSQLASLKGILNL